MKIICAPDSYKETLSAHQVASAMARGIQQAANELNVTIDADVCPVGDGGEGTMDALVGALGGEIHSLEVLDPVGRPIAAEYAIVKPRSRTLSSVKISAADVSTTKPWGVVELARASGLALVAPSQRNPMNTTSFGTGQLIRSAMESGCERVIVCIGGSATVDGGAGIAQALGARFYDAHGRLITQPICGGMLSMITRVVPPAALPAILVACDVTNPLCGPHGAAHVFGPQKGATREQVQTLDESLARFASIVGGDPDMPGAGAAGGAGFGLAALCHATLVRGVDLVLDAVGFSQRCDGAALVLTGEGRLDRQSLHGKACMGVAKAAASRGVPTIAIVGSTGDGADECLESRGGFLRDYCSLTDLIGRHAALHAPQPAIQAAARHLTSAFINLDR